MRLLIVSLRGPTLAARGGGAQAYVRGLGAAWVRTGHAVTLVCAQERLPEGSVLPSRETVDGIEIHRVGTPERRLQPLLQAARRFARGADAVVENLMAAPLALPWWLRGMPLVAVKHHVHALSESVRASVLDQTLLPLAYRGTPIVVPSERTAAALRHLGFRDALLHVLPPPIVAPEAPSPEASGGIRSTVPTVLYLGALHLSRKRLDDLLDAFRAVQARVPGARLVLAGDGPDRRRLEVLAQGLNVSFLGHVSEADKSRLMADAWVFASPSTEEGFGMTWIEAGASGVPLVGYRLDGLDTVDDSASRLVDPGDVDGLADALVRVLTDPGLRQRLSDSARANAARFTTDATSSAVLALLQSNAQDASF